MPFTDIAPPEIRSSKSGISCSLADGKRGAAGIFRISFTKAAQEQIFGGPIAGKRFFAKAGRGQDEGRLLLTPHEDGDLEALICTTDLAMQEIAARFGVSVGRVSEIANGLRDEKGNVR